WKDVSNNVLEQAWFPIGFPNTTSKPQQLQVSSNAASLQTFETLTDVKLFLTGNTDDLQVVQSVWPNLGGPTRPELNGGYEISFDFGRTFIRFDTSHGLESDPLTWIPLPVEAVGVQGRAGTLGAFDAAHLIVRVIVPPGAVDYRKLDVKLAMDFDII
ncbi:MAG TPA: hypothetical protein VM577_09690, partial [Anaerovoracaceae bacterium]|nr:hypothetical protein [Anaerovoracaceae bacterium]